MFKSLSFVNVQVLKLNADELRKFCLYLLEDKRGPGSLG